MPEMMLFFNDFALESADALSVYFSDVLHYKKRLTF